MTDTQTPPTPSTLERPRAKIQLHGVGKVYPGSDVPAVADLDLEIPEGEILVLVGPSGCGKSTTLRLINRMIEPTSGRIIFDGEDVTTVDADRLRRRIGYVIQQIGLFPHQTIAQNISTVPRLLGWDKTRTAARVDELLELTGLDPNQYRDRYPKELSGGQAQRVGVARALGGDPEVLLMDEPFGAIDPITRDRLQNEFLRLQSELKKTIVFVTHDIDEAIKMGDRIAILGEQSVIRQFDTPERILAYPVDDFVSDFIGSGSTLKGLNFERVRDLELAADWPIVSVDTDRASARQLYDSSPEKWMLVLDREQRPIRWVQDRHLDDTSIPLDQAGARVEALVAPNATLHDALEEMLLSNAGQAVVVDEKGRCQGILDIERLADVLKRLRSQAKKHYEQLAVAEAAEAAEVLAGAGGTGSNGAGAGH
ncbi:MAG: betaine/proline/choline family ABC transporter ATP-binding protein [Ilumatobacter sp.]|jgi:osmoprotectant transport system ATP-binding protein|uniref:betaine/proline/choline family ABC transporter ATP-binding protein n=1 Tax=Ilumatobacter sp. TaxID=1967498 RepID=UPI0039193696